ncbi:hypothetical protein J2W14_002513 [Pseudarthrobacter oxydans]|nr:hypothetical protein [Pseudarthrobacter oxydans]MDP9983111.1 hypothetical protein [Pseudarthrobacter oxydans]
MGVDLDVPEGISDELQDALLAPLFRVQGPGTSVDSGDSGRD